MFSRSYPTELISQVPTFVGKMALCNANRRISPGGIVPPSLAEAQVSPSGRVPPTCRLSREMATNLNVVGPAARASGIDRDVRRDHPYAAYGKLDFLVPTQSAGDVSARMKVKMDEVRESFSLIEQALDSMPSGPVRASVGEVPQGRIAYSLVESPRGELVHWVLSGRGTPARHKVRDASFCNWLALEQAVLGDIVPDFPLINKSFNLSYAGNDL